MENPMKMDDLGVPPFKETPRCLNFFFCEEKLEMLIAPMVKSGAEPLGSMGQEPSRISLGALRGRFVY